MNVMAAQVPKGLYEKDGNIDRVKCRAEHFYFVSTALNLNDSWLQDRCKEQELVHHIRHHIDLCETVERDAMTNSYLSAMQLALDGTFNLKF